MDKLYIFERYTKKHGFVLDYVIMKPENKLKNSIQVAIASRASTGEPNVILSLDSLDKEQHKIGPNRHTQKEILSIVNNAIDQIDLNKKPERL